MRTLEQSINGYLDGALDAEDVRALEAELAASAEARQTYWQVAKTHATLAQFYQERSAESLGDNLVVGDFMPKAKPSLVKRALWSTVPFASAAAVMMTFFLMQDESPAPTTMASASGYIARWEGDWKFLQPSELELAPGEQKELVFVNGVRVALEGPLQGSLVNPDRMALQTGRIGVHVPSGAEGFTVNTPAGEVVDFGTRFGLAVDGSNLHAEVFEGRIDVNVGQKNYRMEGQKSLQVTDRQSRGVANGSNDLAFPAPSRTHRLEAFGSFDQPGLLATPHPHRVDEWAGDQTRAIGPISGVTPRHGAGMLQFLATTASPDASEKLGSQIWRVVDLEQITTKLGTRPQQVTLRAYANRTANTVDNKFQFELAGQSGSQESFTWSDNREPRALTDLLTDDDPTTWQEVVLNLQLPTDLRFLIVMAGAIENKSPQSVAPDREFPGHFVDDLSLTFTTQSRPSLVKN